MVAARARLPRAAAFLAVCCHYSAAFYIPGVAPREYTDNEVVEVKVRCRFFGSVQDDSLPLLCCPSCRGRGCATRAGAQGGGGG